MNTDLIQKYDVQAPRYTSYPTVPYWNSERIHVDDWILSLNTRLAKDNHISLYIHLPFCESLCTYCGCNTRITVNHAVEEPYVEAVLKEWHLYLSRLDRLPIIDAIHLGGGTPTFFKPENLKRLIQGILKGVKIAENKAFSFEAHPHNTTEQHLIELFNLGFTRLSLGIQDFDPVVQKLINRKQSFDEVASITNRAREIGYTSINYDLIYGLPQQKTASIVGTIESVASLKPDRIAFYSYAHVPWIKPAQRGYTEADLPKGAAKRLLYETGRELLLDYGYKEIGMDHFALPGDELFEAAEKGKLHRNFMGYTVQNSPILIGLGVSSISDSWSYLVQNAKTLEQYHGMIQEGIFPIVKGHALTQQDLIIRKHLLNLICKHETTWTLGEAIIMQLDERQHMLADMENDGLIEMKEQSLKVTETGKPFVRNIAMAIDAYLAKNNLTKQVFSAAV